MTYEMKDGIRKRLKFGSAEFEVMGQLAAGRLVFGPEDIEPMIGRTVIDSAGLKVNWETGEIEVMEAIPLK